MDEFFLTFFEKTFKFFIFQTQKTFLIKFDKNAYEKMFSFQNIKDIKDFFVLIQIRKDKKF